MQSCIVWFSVRYVSDIIFPPAYIGPALSRDLHFAILYKLISTSEYIIYLEKRITQSDPNQDILYDAFNPHLRHALSLPAAAADRQT